MILIGGGDGIYRWTPGASWPVFHSLQHKTITHLALGSAGAWAAVDGEGLIHESRDYGLNWRTIPEPEAQGISWPTALAIGGPNPGIVVLAVRESGLHYRTLGSVKGWTRLPDPNSAAESTPVRATVRLLSSAPANPKLWLMAIAGGGLYRSSDACSSWSKCAELPAETLAVRVLGSEPGKELVVAGTSKGVWASEDGGSTWSERSQGLGPSRYVTAVEVNPEDPNSWLAGAAPQRSSESTGKGKPAIMGFSLFESKDRGKTWAQVSAVFRSCSSTTRSATFGSIPPNPSMPSRRSNRASFGGPATAAIGGNLWPGRSAPRVLAAAP